VLEPLRVEHAAELAPLLDDLALHRFTGGRPASFEELRERYARWGAGWSPDGDERWLNWTVRRRVDTAAVGWIQATVSTEDVGVCVAELAWTIGSRWQRRGFAREAAAAVLAWLSSTGVNRIIAHLHPEHEASIAVARGLELVPTGQLVNGEVRWVRDL